MRSISLIIAALLFSACNLETTRSICENQEEDVPGLDHQYQLNWINENSGTVFIVRKGRGSYNVNIRWHDSSDNTHYQVRTCRIQGNYVAEISDRGYRWTPTKIRMSAIEGEFSQKLEIITQMTTYDVLNMAAIEYRRTGHRNKNYLVDTNRVPVPSLLQTLFDNSTIEMVSYQTDFEPIDPEKWEGRYRDVYRFVHACHTLNVEGLSEALEAGVDINTSFPYSDFNTCLIEVMMNYTDLDKKEPVIEFLLKNGADPNVTNEDGFGVFRAVIDLYEERDGAENGDRILDKLVAGGLDVNRSIHKGLSPLHATFANHGRGGKYIPLAKRLLVHGALMFQASDSYSKDHWNFLRFETPFKQMMHNRAYSTSWGLLMDLAEDKPTGHWEPEYLPCEWASSGQICHDDLVMVCAPGAACAAKLGRVASIDAIEHVATVIFNQQDKTATRAPVNHVHGHVDRYGIAETWKTYPFRFLLCSSEYQVMRVFSNGQVWVRKVSGWRGPDKMVLTYDKFLDFVD